MILFDCSSDTRLLAPFILSRESDLLDGHLLGDGSVFVTGYDTHREAVFVITSKYKEYAQWIVDNTDWFSECKVNVHDTWDKRTEKFYRHCTIKSISHPILTERRKLWYPNGKKIVPRNLVLTRNLLLRWYLDDGNWHSKGLYLNTQGFIYQDVEFLQQLLMDFLQFKVTIQKHSPNRYRLFIPKRGGSHSCKSSVNNIERFFEVIGDCPVSCLRHRWGE
jgi:hypothetical protein